MNVLELVQRETGYSYRRKGTGGKEYAGKCPFCQAGEDRFLLWPGENRYWCRVCDRKGDAIQFLRDFKHMSFHEAKEYLGEGSDCCDRTNHKNNNNHNNDNYHNNHNNSLDAPLPKEAQTRPGAAWLEPAAAFLAGCQAELRAAPHAKALAWLQGRRLAAHTIADAGLGYNPADQYLDRAAWGLPPAQDDRGRAKRLWLPRGIVIPWLIDGELWGIRIRRPQGDPKYYWIPGGTPALYRADTLTPDRPAVLVEGEIDALTIAQAAGDLAGVVATGSTHGGRRVRWLARLNAAPAVLVAYDADDAGEAAAHYWLSALSNARRWRPYWSDPNDMARDGVDVRGWVAAGLAWAAAEPAGVQPDAVVSAGPAVEVGDNPPAQDNGLWPGQESDGAACAVVHGEARASQIQELKSLIGVPLVFDQVDRANEMAAACGVSLTWQRIDLNAPRRGR